MTVIEARELEGFEYPFTYITGVGGLLKGAVKTGAKKATQEVTNLLRWIYNFFQRNK
ncbi:hypothetical protein [Brevibacillus laterosporus]|uniref:Uncharacterized protein n=1 Tax=Brevibacillus laterosporus LMG 15441 TaxID=1042163 RepID=A0A075R538_BRELA|nr:hypothetical protein [Brevibacillus laterosporus]AIG26591.1 hypothetical protein BRLA_c022700 [Brevibacillus laterosporus LMG 15441]